MIFMVRIIAFNFGVEKKLKECYAQTVADL